MATELLRKEPDSEPTVEQRVELVFDFTRRIALLEDLLATARQRRAATDTEAGLSAAEQAALDQAELDNTALKVVAQPWTI